MSVSFLTMVVLEKGIGSDGDSPILTNIFIGSNILWVGAVVADMFEYGTSSPPTPPIGMFSTRPNNVILLRKAIEMAGSYNYQLCKKLK